MSMNKASLKKIAQFAKLNITDEDIEKMDIINLIDFLGEIKSVDTTGIEPMFSIMDHTLPFREDVVQSGNIAEELLKNAPDKSGVKYGYFAVPLVIGDDE